MSISIPIARMHKGSTITIVTRVPHMLTAGDQVVTFVPNGSDFQSIHGMHSFVVTVISATELTISANSTIEMEIILDSRSSHHPKIPVIVKVFLINHGS